MNIQKVKLEFVRKGPEHNQLLSPLTQYVALCGNHDPEWVQVPFEHYPFLRKHRAFRYVANVDQLPDEVRELSETLTRMLAGIQSLRSELRGAVENRADLIELELVLAASELALLPFELVAPPSGPPRMLADCPVVIVRSTRRVPRSELSWPYRPGILVCIADPNPRQAPVPAGKHLLALRKSLEPWLPHANVENLSSLKEYLTLLPCADMEQIRTASSQNHFSHVHILAHGKRLGGDDGSPARYGLILHDSGDKTKEHGVNGEQLLSALRGPDGRLPTVVTVAGCDTGDVGTVMIPGASIAHELHHGGIPFVVASQFPLSYRGSAIMTETLYRGLLSVKDPRQALHETVSALHIHAKPGVGCMDWTSIVSYAALPKDLDRQLAKARVRQVRQAMDALIATVDLNVVPEPRVRPEDGAKAGEPLFTKAWAGLEKYRNKLEKNSAPEHQGEIQWFFGSVYKRWAEAVVNFFPKWKTDMETPGEEAPWKEVPAILLRARAAYLTVYTLEHSSSALVHALAVSAFLSGVDNRAELDDLYKDEWSAAVSATNLLHRMEPAPPLCLELIRNRIELGLMAPLFNAPDKSQTGFIDPGQAYEPAGEIRKLLNMLRLNRFELYSLRRQIKRYELFVTDEEINKITTALLTLLEAPPVPRTWPAVVAWSKTGEVA